MKQIGAWFGVFLMVLTGYFAFWPIPIAPNAWVAQPAPGYVGPHAQNTKLAGLKNIDIGKEVGPEHIAFGPDGKLYVPVGAPCNICLSEDSIFATIARLEPDGSNLEIVAHGVRNSVGFDWQPGTNELWFTDNGRDWLGDDSPDCELDRSTKVGGHYGYPFCHGGDTPDPEFSKQRDCAEFIPPAAKLGAHVAPLGLRFYTGNMFPNKYKNAIFIAEHGSWNRTSPVGYQLVAAFPQADGSAVTEVFAEGWLEGARTTGRPVDVLVAPDGSLLVSDDAADRIYRISYSSP